MGGDLLVSVVQVGRAGEGLGGDLVASMVQVGGAGRRLASYLGHVAWVQG